MGFIYTILSFTVVLGLIVLVHEFGHYAAARMVGVRVEIFSFGMGKKVFGKKIGATEFRLSLFPIGGYVKLSGEDDYDKKDPRPYDFHSKNRAQKIFILFAGPFMNICLAVFILTTINLSGVETEMYKFEPPRIGMIEKGSPAEKAGLKEGDLILEVNGNHVENWKDLELEIGSNPNMDVDIRFNRFGKVLNTITSVKGDNRYSIGEIGIYWNFKVEIYEVVRNSPAFHAGIKKGDILLSISGKEVNFLNIFEMISSSTSKKIKLEILRKGKKLMLDVIPKEGKDGKGEIGVQLIRYSPMRTVRYNLPDAVMKSVRDIKKLTFLVFGAFKKMIIGKLSPKNLSGPIEIAKFSQKAMESGLKDFFMLIAFISLQLGIINLFPIPALDGGHMMIYSVEAVIRREFSMKIKAALINTGFLLLLILMGFVILNDIAKVLPNGWHSLLPF